MVNNPVLAYGHYDFAQQPLLIGKLLEIAEFLVGRYGQVFPRIPNVC